MHNVTMRGSGVDGIVADEHLQEVDLSRVQFIDDAPNAGAAEKPKRRSRMNKSHAFISELPWLRKRKEQG